MAPRQSVVRNGDGAGVAWSFGSARNGGEVVVYQHMSAVGKRQGVGARLILRHVDKRHLAPCVAVVAAPCRGKPPVAGAPYCLQAAVF